MNGNQPVGPADNSDVEYEIVPLKDGKPLIPASGGADWSYRILCDRIPANSQSHFVAALEVINGPEAKNLFGSPRTASWMSVTARFQTSGRDRVEKIFRCPTGEACRDNRKFR
jgi:hypothetical protein